MSSQIEDTFIKTGKAPPPPDSDDDSDSHSDEPETPESSPDTEIPSLRKAIKRMVIDEGDQAILDGQHSARFSAARDLWTKKKKPESAVKNPPVKRVLHRRASVQYGSSTNKHSQPSSGLPPTNPKSSTSRHKAKWKRPTEHVKSASFGSSPMTLNRVSSKNRIKTVKKSSTPTPKQVRPFSVRDVRGWVHMSDIVSDSSLNSFLSSRNNAYTGKLTRSFSADDIPSLKRALSLSNGGSLFLNIPRSSSKQMDDLFNAATQIVSDDSSDDDDLDSTDHLTSMRKKSAHPGRSHYPVEPSPLHILHSQHTSIEKLSTKIFPDNMKPLPPLSVPKTHSSSHSWVPPIPPISRGKAVSSLKGVRLIMKDMLSRRLTSEINVPDSASPNSVPPAAQSSISFLLSSLLDQTENQPLISSSSALNTLDETSKNSDNSVDTMAVAGLILVVDRILSRLDIDSVKDINLLSSIDEEDSQSSFDHKSVQISDSVALAALKTKVDDLMDYPRTSLVHQKFLSREKIEKLCNSHVLMLKKPISAPSYSQTTSPPPLNRAVERNSHYSGSVLPNSVSVKSFGSTPSIPAGGSPTDSTHSSVDNRKSLDISDLLNTSINSVDSSPLYPHKEFNSNDNSIHHQEFKAAPISTTLPSQEFSAVPITSFNRPSLVDYSDGSGSGGRKGSKKGAWKALRNTLKKKRKPKASMHSTPGRSRASLDLKNSESRSTPMLSKTSNASPLPSPTPTSQSRPSLNHASSISSLTGTYDGDSDDDTSKSPKHSNPPGRDSADMGELGAIMEKMASKDLTDQRALAPSISGSKVVSFENFSLD